MIYIKKRNPVKLDERDRARAGDWGTQGGPKLHGTRGPTALRNMGAHNLMAQRLDTRGPTVSWHKAHKDSLNLMRVS